MNVLELGRDFRRDPFRVGLVALALGVVAALVVLLFSVVSFGTQSYTAVLEQTAGLRVGEDVEVHGVPVGQVKSIELDGTSVRVGFVMDDDIELGDASTAEVKVATLLGTHYLAVDPRGNGSIETIPMERTTVPFNLQDVLERGTGNLEQLDAPLLARSLSEFSKTLSASSDNLEPALLGIARLSEAVQKRSDQTGRLLEATRTVTTQLSASSEDLVGLMRQANLVIDEITTRREAIHTLLVETTTLTKNLSGIVADTSKDLGPAFEKLNTVLGILHREDDTLKTLLDRVAPTVRYFANVTGNGPWGDLWLEDLALMGDDARCRLGGC